MILVVLFQSQNPMERVTKGWPYTIIYVITRARTPRFSKTCLWSHAWKLISAPVSAFLSTAKIAKNKTEQKTIGMHSIRIALDRSADQFWCVNILSRSSIDSFDPMPLHAILRENLTGSYKVDPTQDPLFPLSSYRIFSMIV